VGEQGKRKRRNTGTDHETQERTSKRRRGREGKQHNTGEGRCEVSVKAGRLGRRGRETEG
jgi:hypothetical protein